jgi:hypothetical protein
VKITQTSLDSQKSVLRVLTYYIGQTFAIYLSDFQETSARRSVCGSNIKGQNARQTSRKTIERQISLCSVSCYYRIVAQTAAYSLNILPTSYFTTVVTFKANTKLIKHRSVHLTTLLNADLKIPLTSLKINIHIQPTHLTVH